MLRKPCEKCLVGPICKRNDYCEYFNDYRKTIKKLSDIQVLIGLLISFVPLIVVLIKPDMTQGDTATMSAIFFFISLLVTIPGIVRRVK